LPCDSPRTGTRPSAPGRIAGPRECASGEPARGGGSGPARYCGSAGWPATATIGGLPVDRRCCNIVRADAVAGTAAHNLSTDRAAVGSKLGLAWEMIEDILGLGPREVLLPKVKPRREALTSHRGALMRCNLLSAKIRPDCTTLPLPTPLSHRRPTSWPRLGREPPIATLARLRRKTGTLIRRY
jgi:hypothetical protein